MAVERRGASTNRAVKIVTECCSTRAQCHGASANFASKKLASATAPNSVELIFFRAFWANFEATKAYLTNTSRDNPKYTIGA